MPRILVVDDSEFDRRMVGSVLNQDHLLFVEFATDGQHALERLRAVHADLIISDLVMPNMDGLQLVNAVREKYPALPMIIVTSQGSEEAAVAALKAGAAGYVPKKLLAGQLLKTVHELLAMSDAQQARVEVINRLAAQQSRFVLENDLRLVDALVSHVVRTMAQMKIGDDAQRRCMGVALKEAMVNAMLHGNLQMEPAQRVQDAARQMAEAQRRAALPACRDRRVFVDVSLSPSEVAFTVRDQGRGFDVRKLLESVDPQSIDGESKRGFVLMSNFMDSVRYNAAGNCVTLSRCLSLPRFNTPLMFNTPEADALLAKLQVFPADNPWNEDISARPVHPRSGSIVWAIGADAPIDCQHDMSFILVPPDQKRVPVTYVEGPLRAESDPGPFPIPDDAPIEGWPLRPAGASLQVMQRGGTRGERRMIVVDPANRMLYEFLGALRTDRGWVVVQSTVWDLKRTELRPEGWASADAAGLPIFPGVVRFDQCQRGAIEHALRVSIRKTRREFVYPATRFSSVYNHEDFPRMGERFRLRADYDITRFSPHVQVILQALKKYGMIVADNTGDWRLSVAPDARIQGLDELRRLRGQDFDVIVPTGADEGRQTTIRPRP